MYHTDANQLIKNMKFPIIGNIVALSDRVKTAECR
jgi:hypothetical protein